MAESTPLPSRDTMEPTSTRSRARPAERVSEALGRRSNWEQLGKFCVVGASGYVVNLVVYILRFLSG